MRSEALPKLKKPDMGNKILLCLLLAAAAKQVFSERGGGRGGSYHKPYGQYGSNNYGNGGSNYGHGDSNYGQGGNNYGQGGINYGNGGNNYGQGGINYGNGGNNYGHGDNNYGNGGDNFGNGYNPFDQDNPTCGSRITLKTGILVTFMTPMDWENYLLNPCRWIFEAENEDDRLEITCQEFNVGKRRRNGGCRGYVLKLVKKCSQKGRCPERFCGMDGPTNEVAEDGKFKVVFRTKRKYWWKFSRDFSCTVIAVPSKSSSEMPSTTTPKSTSSSTTTTMKSTSSLATTTMESTSSPATTTMDSTSSPATTTMESTSSPATTTMESTSSPATTTMESTSSPATTIMESTSSPATTTIESTSSPATTTMESTSSPATTTITTPELCRCGRKGRPGTTRIVGGENAGLHEFPWQAAILPSSNLSQVVCGGSIINNMYVLTAAFCVIQFNNSQLTVALGEHDTSRMNETQETIYLNISSIIIHNQFNPGTSENDIALIKLSRPIDLNSSVAIKPICFPDPYNLYVNEKAAVTGWGLLSTVGSQPDILQQVNVTIRNNTNCQSPLTGSSVSNNMICASDPGRDSCQGDLGGPLIVKEDDHYVQVGIVGNRLLCANPIFPGIYTRVGNYLDWINENVGNSTTCMK